MNLHIIVRITEKYWSQNEIKFILNIDGFYIVLQKHIVITVDSWFYKKIKKVNTKNY